MPFVPDSQFEKKEKVENIKQQVMRKKEQSMINDIAKENEEKKLKMDNAKIIKEVMKNTHLNPNRNKQPVIKLKDIQNAMKIEKFVEEEKEKQIEEILDNEEFQEVKDGFINILAIPQTHPIKRKIFANKLQQSKTINSFLNDNVILRMFNKANQNIKFGVVYTVKYLETNKDYDTLLLAQQLRAQQLKEQLATATATATTAPAPAEVKEETKEEIKEETKEEIKEEETKE